jgi:hypothetical protein
MLAMVVTLCGYGDGGGSGNGCEVGGNGDSCGDGGGVVVVV